LSGYSKEPKLDGTKQQLRKRGRPLSQKAQQAWLVRKLQKIVPRKDKAFVKQAAEQGLKTGDLGAMFYTIWALLADQNGVRIDDDGRVVGMESQHWFGTAVKLLDVGRKLLELQAIEAAEVPGRIVIDVSAPDVPLDGGDEIPMS
tara:strand:+ start:178 stop:612 length:435 start_codon:yes stop_codon:yes gene_type:complete